MYQAPNRLGGYVDSGDKVRVYVAVIDSVEYQSNQVSPSASTDHLTFQKQASQGASTLGLRFRARKPSPWPS